MASSNEIMNDTTSKVGTSNSPGNQISLVASVFALADPKQVVAALVLLYAIQTIYYCYFHQLKNVPGPPLARFSQIWRNIRYFRGSWLEDVVALHEKYGDVVRIAPNEVSFVDRDGLRALYGHGKVSQKTDWYHSWYVPNMQVSFFATTDIKLHRHLRSRVTAAYSMSSMLAMEGLIQDVASRGWTKFRELVARGKPVELDRLVNYFTFDVVGTLALGGPIGMLEQEKDVDGIIGSIHDGFYLMANMGNVPLQMFWFNNPVAQWLVKNLGGKRLNAFSVFLDWLEARVDARMKAGKTGNHKDLLQHFIDAKDQSGNPVQKGDVMIEGVNILGAGADTTTVAILAVLGALLTNPSQKKRLIVEIDQAYEELGLEEKGEEISFKDTENLPFLSAVIKESMRLHPSIVYQLPRVSPQEGVQVGSYHFDRNVVCGISAASMNRSVQIFGPDAGSWIPERWIAQSEADKNRISEMSRDLTTFGMGSRSCVGRNLALIEVHKYIAQFFRHFDAEVVNPDKPWVTKSQWFAIQRKFWVVLKERHHEQKTNISHPLRSSTELH